MTKWVEPSCIYFFKVDNRNTKKRCELFSKLTIKIQNNVNDVRVFIVNFQFYFTHFSSVSIVDFVEKLARKVLVHMKMIEKLNNIYHITTKNINR